MFGREGSREGVWSCELKRKPSISGRIFDYTRQTSPLYCPTALIVCANNMFLIFYFLYYIYIKNSRYFIYNELLFICVLFFSHLLL